MEQFILIITVGLIVMLSPMLSKILRTPIVVVELFLGMSAGFLGLIYPNAVFKEIGHFGFLYLMFLAGLEINFQAMREVIHDLTWSVILFFGFQYLFVALICLLFSLNPVYVVTIPIFSVGMLMMLIKEYGKEEKWLSLAFSVGVVGEIISIITLTIFNGWLEYGFTKQFYVALATIVGVIFLGLTLLKLFYILFWWFPKLKAYLIPDIDRFDQDIRFSLSLFVLLTAMMYALKIDLVLGAFTAGLFMKMFFHSKVELTEKLASVGFGFFIPLFFIYTGSTVKLEMVDESILWHALWIMVSLISVRVLGAFLTFHKYFSAQKIVLFALSNAMPLTFLVAISMLAYRHGLIAQKEYFAFIIASMVDGLVLMVVIRILHRWFKKKV